MSGPPSDVVRAAQQSTVTVAPAGETTLQKLRDKINWFLGRQTDKKRLEDELKAVNVDIYQAERKELPDLLDEARVPRITIDADGGTQYEAKAQAYYKANIAAEWEEPRRAAAFAWLDQNGHGDLIKTDVTLSFAREDRAFAVAFAQWLRMVDMADLIRQMCGADFALPEGLVQLAEGKNSPVQPGITAKENVPWNTLTKWLQEMVEKGETPPLDVIGGEVGRIVKLKEV